MKTIICVALLVLLPLTQASSDNAFKRAYRFWTSQDLKVLFKKDILRQNPASENQLKLNKLISNLENYGLPSTYLRQASPYLDIMSVKEKLEGDPDVMGGMTPFMMFETKYGLTSLQIPNVYFDATNDFLKADLLGAELISKFYHEMFHLYMYKVVSKNQDHPFALLQRILMIKLRNQYPTLTEAQAADITEELLAYDIEYVMNDYVLTKQSLQRRVDAGKPISEPYVTLLKKNIYHPLTMKTRGYSNSSSVDFETIMALPETFQKLFLQDVFGSSISGALEKDFPAYFKN